MVAPELTVSNSSSILEGVYTSNISLQWRFPRYSATESFDTLFFSKVREPDRQHQARLQQSLVRTTRRSEYIKVQWRRSNPPTTAVVPATPKSATWEQAIDIQRPCLSGGTAKNDAAENAHPEPQHIFFHHSSKADAPRTQCKHIPPPPSIFYPNTTRQRRHTNLTPTLGKRGHSHILPSNTGNTLAEGSITLSANFIFLLMCIWSPKYMPYYILWIYIARTLP